MHPLLILIFALFLIITTWAVYYKIRPRTVRAQLIAELQQNPDWKRIKKTEQLFMELYQGVYAANVSKHERKRKHLTDDSFIYGEIDFLPFYALLEKIKPLAGEIYYDLGSGAGKSVFTAALCYDLQKAVGIELLSGLHSIATVRLKKIRSLLKTHDQYFVSTYLRRIESISFIHENIVNVNIADGDIIFINATCFSYPLLSHCLQKLTYLKPGSRVIITSKKIEHPQFEHLQQSFAVMSWGLCSVNFYIKR